MDLRSSLLQGSCSFEAVITADFGDKTYCFTMECQGEPNGDITFVIQEPEYIQGISGLLQGEGGNLTFGDTALAFPLEGDGVLSPCSGPWVLIRALQCGYIRSCSREDTYYRITVNDSYREDALMLDIWLNEENAPVRADIYEENRRIMALEVKNFQMK